MARNPRTYFAVASALLAITFVACAASGVRAPVAAAPAPAPAATTAAAPLLDWSASWRWVHLDTVDATQVALFEGARRGWLAALHAAGPGWWPDGRPLFWSGRGDATQRYVTIYPYASWQDLVARTSAVAATQLRVGEKAVADYDAGDAALVPPHRSELWRRLPELDFAPATGALADERAARRAVLERRRMVLGKDEEAMEALWKEVRGALGASGYRSTCRAFWSVYGDGDLVLFCMTATEDGAVATVAEALRSTEATAALAARLEALAPLHERLALVRRDDLSNLPPPSASGTP